MPKQEGAFAIPAVALVALIFMIAAAPRAARQPGSGPMAGTGSLGRSYPSIVAVVAALLLYMTILMLLLGAGAALDVPAFTTTGVGIAITLLGNSLGKIQRNSAVGIRTPWTLASAEVWARTNRLAGWLFVLAGVATTLAGILGWGLGFFLAAVLAAALVSVVYSYLLWRRLGGPWGGRPRNE